MLRILGGLTPPTAGAVLADGRPVWADGRPDRDTLRHLAMVFQDANLLPWFSVEANIALPLRLRGVRRDARTAEARRLCELVGIAGFGGHRPSELSIGMRHRASLARAVVESPSILLLDEPFAALDPLLRAELRADVARVIVRTMVLVTHDVVEALTMATRIVLLADGAVVLDVPRERFAHDPHPLAAAYMATARAAAEVIA